jgi:hypothetical protein
MQSGDPFILPDFGDHAMAPGPQDYSGQLDDQQQEEPKLEQELPTTVWGWTKLIFSYLLEACRIINALNNLLLMFS